LPSRRTPADSAPATSTAAPLCEGAEQTLTSASRKLTRRISGCALPGAAASRRATHKFVTDSQGKVTLSFRITVPER
jgi:hypothetical protein